MNVNDNDVIINLGDTVDRGPKIKEMLDFFMNRKNGINIMGNHDFTYLNYASNGLTNENSFMWNQGLSDTVAQLGEDFQKYADFIRTWKLYVTMPKPSHYVFCHSTYPWKTEENGIFNEMHMWERWYDRSREDYKKYEGPIIVHGHTPCEKPYEFIDDKLIGINLDMGGPYDFPWSGLRGMRLSDGKIFEQLKLD
jgi:serine/threonine protein phosphatase 1